MLNIILCVALYVCCVSICNFSCDLHPASLAFPSIRIHSCILWSVSHGSAWHTQGSFCALRRQSCQFCHRFLWLWFWRAGGAQKDICALEIGSHRVCQCWLFMIMDWSLCCKNILRHVRKEYRVDHFSILTPAKLQRIMLPKHLCIMFMQFKSFTCDILGLKNSISTCIVQILVQCAV